MILWPPGGPHRHSFSHTWERGVGAVGGQGFDLAEAADLGSGKMILDHWLEVSDAAGDHLRH